MASRYKPKMQGRMSDARRAWLTCNRFRFVLYEDDEESTEPGNDVRLLIDTGGGGRPKSLMLTAMTHKELVAMREFFTMVLDRAEPVCAERDKVAQEAFERGDDAIPRLYRQVPQLVIRERKEPPHDEGVQE